MDSAHETLIDIASASQRLGSILDRSVGSKLVESSWLDKIVVGTRIVLEALNRTFLLKDGNADDRLVDWISSNEPQACLRTLKQMEAILNRKAEYGLRSLLKAPRSTRTQDKLGEAIKLFQMRKSYFHFLVETGIWNRQSGAQRLPLLTTQPDVSHVNLTINEQSLAMTVLSGDVGASDCTLVRGIGVTEKNQGINLKKLDDILKWLNAWSSRETHERTVLLRQPGTCTWLPETGEFKKWRSGENSFLWLHGKPGAGKSVLAASVIEDLKNTLQDGENMAYFYCNFREERSMSAVEVLRSMLSQLLKQFRRHAVDPGDLLNELVEERDEGASTIDNVILLTRHIAHAAERSHQPPFFIIDALDECRDVEELLDALTKLQKDHVRLLTTSRPLQTIKDKLVGLPFIDMEKMEYQVSMDIRLHVQREMDSHRRLRVVDARLKDEIYCTLCEKADGMFRWVQCQLATLKQCVTMADFREALNNLPGDLEMTYERILLEIDRTHSQGNVARRALDWLVAALEPLRLCQIMEGLSVDVKERILDRSSVPVHGFTLLDTLSSLVMHDEMTDIVILSHFSVKEYLVAESTRRKHPAYYVDQQAAHTQLALVSLCYVGIALERYRISDDDEAWSCGTYDIQTDHENASTTSSHPRTHSGSSLRLVEPHPLLRYVLSAGFSHLDNVNPRNKVILRAVKDFQLDVGQHSLEWDQLCDYYSRNGHISHCTSAHDLALYILIRFASDPLLRSFIGRTELQPKDGTNPLIYAATFWKNEHARTLLSRGANLNHRGLDVWGSHQVLPLEAAVRSNNHGAVVLFLNEGSHVPHKLFEDALMEYRSHSYWGPPPTVSVTSTMLQTDEFVEWAADFSDESVLLRTLDPERSHSHYNQPSEQDIDTVQRRLLQVGCDPFTELDEASLRFEVSVRHISTVKHMLFQNIPFPPDIILDASKNENSTMIRLFLDLEYKANVPVPKRDTPIHIVLRFGEDAGCLEKCRVLIDACCDPSARNLAGKAPLHLAARYGRLSVVNYLLALQVPLPPDILLEASEATVIRSLIRQGADVHAIAADGSTALHLVVVFSLDEVNLLVDAGCDPCIPNALGQTALDVAAEYPSLPYVEYLLSVGVPPSPGILLRVVDNNDPTVASVVTLLIDNGADVRVTRPNGDTLLHLALPVVSSEERSLEKVKILIEAGCDPRACNCAGETLFHVAAQRGYISVMEYLLSLDISVPPDIVLLTRFGGHYATACFLLEKGGNIHAVSEEGDTLLHSAAGLLYENEALDLVQRLVRAGCNPSLCNPEYETPFHIATRQGHISIAKYFLSLGISLPPDILLAVLAGDYLRTSYLFSYLVEEGANISIVAAGGDTLLHRMMSWLGRYGDSDCVEILVDAGCDLGIRNVAGDTPLHAAAKCGCVSVVRYLLSLGLSLPPDILFAASTGYWNRMEMICYLMKEGADVSVVTPDGDTLLHILMTAPGGECFLDCVQVLLHAGCDPCARNAAGQTPIHAAAMHGCITALECFLARGVSLPEDILRISTSDTIHFLSKNGVDVRCVTANVDMQLVHRAFEYDSDGDCMECAKILISAGWDASFRNSAGETPIHIAARHGHIQTIHYLLSQGVPLPPDVLLAVESNDARSYGWGSTLLVRLLIHEGASVNVPKSNGDTPLHLALRASDYWRDDHKDWWEIVEMLLDHGADPSICNAEGKTPLDIAEEYENGQFAKANFMRLVSNSWNRRIRSSS